MGVKVAPLAPAAALALAACATPAPEGYAIADDPLPPEVQSAMDVFGHPRDGILVQDGCYFARRPVEGGVEIVPLTIPGNGGVPGFCVG